MNIIKSYLWKHNIPQGVFAKQIKFSQPYLSQVMSGARPASRDFMSAVVRATKREITFDHFMDDIEGLMHMGAINLPIPPSVNAAHGNNKTGVGRGRYNTKIYKAWIKEAGLELLIQKPKKLKGHFTASIIVDESQRGQSDIDNRIKPIFDLLQKHGTIYNDRLCDGYSAYWGVASKGCKIILREREKLK